MATYNKSADSVLTLSQTAVSLATFRRVAGTTITISGVADADLAPDVPKSADSTLTVVVTCSATKTKQKTAATTLSVSVVAAGLKALLGVPSSTLSLSTVASAYISKDVSAETSLSISGVAERAPSTLNKFAETELQMYQGPILDLEPGKVAFRFPYGGPSYEVLFKKPIFGDQRSQFDQVTVRHSRSGERFSYAKNPTYTRLTMTFENVSKTLAESFLEFAEIAKAQNVQFVDQYQRNWRGVLVSEPRTIQSQAKNACEDVFTVSVEFEGEIV